MEESMSLSISTCLLDQAIVLWSAVANTHEDPFLDATSNQDATPDPSMFLLPPPLLLSVLLRFQNLASQTVSVWCREGVMLLGGSVWLHGHIFDPQLGLIKTSQPEEKEANRRTAPLHRVFVGWTWILGSFLQLEFHLHFLSVKQFFFLYLLKLNEVSLHSVLIWSLICIPILRSL